jgi:hypothetical protein
MNYKNSEFDTHPIIEIIKNTMDSYCNGCVIYCAIKIAKCLLSNNYTEIDSFSGADGEIRVIMYKDNHYIEFTVENEYDIYFLHEEGTNELEYIEHMSLDDCILKIEQLNV